LGEEEENLWDLFSFLLIIYLQCISEPLE